MVALRENEKNRFVDIQKHPRLFLDVRKYNEEDMALILAEERLAELEKRISPYALIFDANGKMLMLNKQGELVPLPVSQEKDLDKIELLGAGRIFEQMKNGYDEIVWFSPCGGNSTYTEDRMVAVSRRKDLKNNSWLRTYWKKDDETESEEIKEKVIKNLEELLGSGGVVFEARGICCLDERSVFFDKARRIVADGNSTIGEINKPDDLRENPVGLRDAGKWYRYLEKYFPEMKEVWEAISEGEDLRKKIENRELAKEIELIFGARMKKAASYYDAVRLGAEVEGYLYRVHSIRLSMGGAHGMSNTAALGLLDSMGTIKSGTFDLFFGLSSRVSNELDSRLEICEICHKAYMKKKKRCPKCFPQN